MTPKAAIFDLDGTLVDTSQEYIYDSVGKTLRDLGLISTPQIGVYATWANNFWKGFADRDELIRSLGLNESTFWETFKKHDSPAVRVANSFVYSDFVVLNELKSQGVRTGVVTDAPSYVALRELELVSHCFDSVVCAGKGISVKPHIGGLMSCLAQLGVDTREAVYLGNANVDVELGRRAKVTHGVVVREAGYKLHSAPDFSVKDLFEFKERFFGR